MCQERSPRRSYTSSASPHAGRVARRFCCAKSVPESYLFIPLGLALSEKQIPQFVGNVNS